MKNIIQVDTATGVAEELQPFLQKHLTESGWALVRVRSAEDMAEAMWSIAQAVGPMFGHRAGYHIMESNGDERRLPVHTEGVSYQHNIIPYLAIGCIIPAISGGETRVFDGRKAARLIDQVPELSGATIEYSTVSNPSVGQVRSLVVPGFGRVLRYRGRVISNRVISSSSLTEDELYQRVDAILEQCVVLCHHWEAGDLLFLDNRITLHDRLPFVGYRQMMRIRYNDENFPRLCYLP